MRVTSTNFICPFCNSSIPIMPSTVSVEDCYFNKSIPHYTEDKSYKTAAIVDINMYSCPSCNKVSFVAQGKRLLKDLYVPLFPQSLARQFPEYVPEPILEDYQEAYSIINLSPKASATLARRCLQGMIRDFWKISKSRLIDEINELQSKVPASQWKAIDAVRSIGNIGAHMEKDINTIIDVDEGEAEKLLKLIELLIDKWYIARHDEEQLLQDIEKIATSKKSN